VDGHDPAVDLPDAPEVLPLHPRRVVAPLAAARLIDHPDGAERVGRETPEHRGQVLLEGVAGVVVVPPGGDQELLEGPDRGAGGQGDRLDALAGQVGQEAPAVGAEVGGRPGLAEAVPEPPQVRRERRAEVLDLLLCHRYSSR
jgi:hypothetical protein